MRISYNMWNMWYKTNVYNVEFCLKLQVVVSVWARWGGPDGIEAWSFGPIFLQCFDTVGWVIWRVKTRPHMTYNVLVGR